MVIDGVSTNRVEKIVERLSPDLAFSKSTVSRLTQELDPQIKKWQEEKLREHYVYLFLEEDLESILTFFDYPDIHQRKIRTTNLIEGVLNKALKQRSKVIGIFPNRGNPVLRYACLRLMENDRRRRF